MQKVVFLHTAPETRDHLENLLSTKCSRDDVIIPVNAPMFPERIPFNSLDHESREKITSANKLSLVFFAHGTPNGRFFRTDDSPLAAIPFMHFTLGENVQKVSNVRLQACHIGDFCERHRDVITDQLKEFNSTFSINFSTPYRYSEVCKGLNYQDTDAVNKDEFESRRKTCQKNNSFTLTIPAKKPDNQPSNPTAERAQEPIFHLEL